MSEKASKKATQRAWVVEGTKLRARIAELERMNREFEDELELKALALSGMDEQLAKNNVTIREQAKANIVVQRRVQELATLLHIERERVREYENEACSIGRLRELASQPTPTKGTSE